MTHPLLIFLVGVLAGLLSVDWVDRHIGRGL